MSRAETWQGLTPENPAASRLMKDGCGRFRWKLTASSASTVTSSRFEYHASRGFLRSRASLFPLIASQVHFTSFAEKGLPSCQVTPVCSLKLSVLLSSLQDQLFARSGTIDSMLCCFTSGSNITRLL